MACPFKSFLVYPVIVFAGVVVWIGLTWLRQDRLCDLAASLGAVYRPRGFLRIGSIEGDWKGQDYVIGSDGTLTSITMRLNKFIYKVWVKCAIRTKVKYG